MEPLTNIGTIKKLMEQHGFQFRKGLGQNFLINPTVCPRMAEMGGADEHTGVLEIGPGFGVLTAELSSRAEKVVAVEIDDRLLPVLKETLADRENVKIVHGDVLKLDLRKLIEEEFGGGRVVVCANLPYYITSPVIMSLLEQRLPVERITVMVQKEAALRLCASPGTRECGAVSAAVRYYCEPKLLFSVSRGSFMPPPNVDSAVIGLNVRKEPAVNADEKHFFSIVRGAFSHRRKTAVNSLSESLGLSKDKVTALFQRCGLAENLRAENLTMEDFAKLSKGISGI